jgi:hypothetical protein
MILLLPLLPLSIQYLILEYVNINNNICQKKIKYYIKNYIHEKDFVYFTIEPLIFIVDNALQVNLTTWFGVQTPEIYELRGSKVIHNDYDRPYCQNLENSFGKIARIISDNVKHFKLKENDRNQKNILFAGTHCPFKRNTSSTNFHKLCHTSNCYSPPNMLDYFKKMNVVDKNLKILDKNNIIVAINNLKKLIILSVIKIIDIYNQKSKNIITVPIFVKNKNHELMFFKLCKPINFKKIYKKLLHKKIINKQNYNSLYLHTPYEVIF